MTAPTEQDEKLRDEIDERLETLIGYLGQRDDRDNWWGFDTNVGTLEDEIEGTLDSIMKLITADRKRVALEAEIAQLKSVVAGYEIYSHDATQFYKSIVKALLNKDERFYREYGEHALYQTDIDHLKAKQEEV